MARKRITSSKKKSGFWLNMNPETEGMLKVHFDKLQRMFGDVGDDIPILVDNIAMENNESHAKMILRAGLEAEIELPLLYATHVSGLFVTDDNWSLLNAQDRKFGQNPMRKH